MNDATELYTVEQIRAIESAALAAMTQERNAHESLMQRAGRAAADVARMILDGGNRGQAVLVLAGPGNNGGDALEAAALLAKEGCRVCIVLLADEARMPSDAKKALTQARAQPASFEMMPSLDDALARKFGLIVDGLFGIGLTRPLAGEYRAVVETMNSLASRSPACPILSLDIPSGLNADTGMAVGVDGIAVRADHTVTFIGNKPGLYTGAGRDHAGQVHVASLGIDDRLFVPSHARLSGIGLFRHVLHVRPHCSHKGSYGNAAVIGGAQGMGGASILAARAAAHCGAGRVFAGFLHKPPAYDSAQPELMCRLVQDIDLASCALGVGPGMGTSRNAHDVLARALAAPVPAVLDADALNLIAAEPGLQQKTANRKAATILTPHPLEAARLLASSSAAVQADRMAAARELARRFSAIVVLKGSGTLIARPDGAIAINPTGNAALATAGTGDVLCGICTAFLAQGWPAWEAAIAAVWLHGAAADELVDNCIGPAGLMANELIPEVRAILNRLIISHANSRGLPCAISAKKPS